MTARATPDRIVARLCARSRADYANPYTALEWPERLPDDAWCFTPELVSLAGTATWAGLDEAQRRRLAFHEAVNFFSLNIHGEKALVEGLAQRLYARDHRDVSPYLHHFLDEENKHMVYFGEFCRRYAGGPYPDRKMALPREYAEGEADVCFFAKVLVFEEIVDVYNLRMARDRRLHPLARAINRLHHRDESRHLVFGRLILRALWARHAPGWDAATRRGVQEYLAAYVVATWKEYWNPAVYRDAGLPDPYGLAVRAFAEPAARAHRVAVSRTALRALVAAGVLAEEPAL